MFARRFLSLPFRAARRHSTASARTKTQIAVVGSGPSGCYVAHHLTKQNAEVHVDLFERLPVPFGLSRYGVAPDHPEVKNVERQFLEMFKSGRVTWIGNVHVGKTLPVDVLRAHYAAVVFATGADVDRRLRLPGEDLRNVLPARDFVRYYNTLPAPFGAPRVCPMDLPAAAEVVVVGNGNVAMDCARVLAAPYTYFAPTDMNAAAVREMMGNRVRRVHIVGRRGVAHSAFTIAEFRELTRYQPHSVRVRVEPFDLHAALQTEAENPRARKRLLELVAKFTAPTPAEETMAQSVAKTPGRGNCEVCFRYNLRPVRFLPSQRHPRRVGAVVFARTDRPQPHTPTTTTPTALSNSLEEEESGAETITVPCDVALTSIGSIADGIPGVPFDSTRGVIPNTRGRVLGAPRLYCAGWAKNGAKGVILRSLMDAQETVASILEDLANQTIPSGTDGTQSSPFYGKFGLIDFFVEKRLEPVSVAGLERIFHVESERGIDLGKRLEKIDSVRSMLDVALGGDIGKKTNNAIRGITNERPDALLYLKELLDDTTDLAPFAKQIAKELPPVMAEQHPPGRLNPSQL